MSKETFQQNITNPKHPVYIISLCIFVVSMFLLYSSSTLYHTFNLSAKVNLRLRKLDHMMIYVLIAGTYTPICLIGLRDAGGTSLFFLVWAVALLGIIQCVFFINCPKWVSALIYIIMGWLCIFSFDDITALLNKSAFGWLLAGGIIYTIGGIIYACKFPVFNRLHKKFGSHEIFHCFVLAGSLCHFVTMYCI